MKRILFIFAVALAGGSTISLAGGSAIASPPSPDAEYQKLIEEMARQSVPAFFSPRAAGAPVDLGATSSRIFERSPELRDRSNSDVQNYLLGSQAERTGARALGTMLVRREPIPQLVILTHQSPNKHLRIDLQPAAAEALRTDPRFAKLPRLALAQPGYPLTNAPLLSQVNLVLYSSIGELPYPIVAKEVFVMGGYASACLARTVADLISAARAAGQNELSINYVDRLVYEDSSNSLFPLEFDGTAPSESAVASQLAAFLPDDLKVVRGSLRTSDDGKRRRLQVDLQSKRFRLHLRVE